jgi:DNA-binding transcriptional MerR regulator
MTTRPGLKMSELADASGVSTGTIKHYLREGLLGGEGDVVRTSRNMAWYPEEFVERIRLIKRLQEERFMPLKLIRDALAEADRPRTERKDVLERHEIPANVLDRLAEIGVLTPDARGGYDPDDVKIIEAIERFRAGGYDEALGFTVYDTLIYKRHLEQLVHEEVDAIMQRVTGEMSADEAADLLERAVEPMRDLVAAMRAKLMIAELQTRRAEQGR